MGRLIKEPVVCGTRVSTRLSPFILPVERFAPAGSTVRQIVDMHKTDGKNAIVWINGERVPKCMWDRIKPKPNALVTVSLVGGGGGGGGKSPLRIVLTIAVIVAAAYLGPMLAAELGFTGAAGGATAATIGSLSAATSATIVSGVISGIVTMAGGMLINALAPAASKVSSGYEGSFAAGTSTATQYTITGAQNRANQYGPLPRVFGKRKVFPVYAAVPYDESVGSDQYVRMLFSFGAGPLELSDFRIGETPLSLFEGVEMEVRNGYSDDAPITLYTHTIREDSLSTRLYADKSRTFESRVSTDELSFDIGFTGLVTYDSAANRGNRTVDFKVEYRNVNDAGWTGYNQVSSADAVTTAPSSSIHYELFSGGAYSYDEFTGVYTYVGDGNGNYTQVTTVVPSKIQSASVDFASVGIRVGDTVNLTSGPNIGSHTVTNVSGHEVSVSSTLTVATGQSMVLIPIVSITAATDQSYKENLRIIPPVRGKFQVRITRLTADNTNTSVRDEAYFSVLRSITYTPPTGSGVDECLVALRIKASGQLNGTISTFNAVAEALIPTLDDDLNWTAPVKNRNPAYASLEVMRGSMNMRPVADSKIVLSAFKDWADYCDELDQNGEPRFQYDAVIDGVTTVQQLLLAIMGSARATLARPGGKISVVVDRPQTVATQLFTPREIQSFKLKRTFYDMPHAVRARFVNPDKGWVQDEVIAYADGHDETTATLFETLELPGVVRASQAWRDARYHLAAAIARPNEYDLVCDINHLMCERGRLIKVQHDVTRWGLGSGRIVERTLDVDGNIVSLTFDETFLLEVGKSYSIRCRLSTGDLILLALSTPADGYEGDTLTLIGTVADADGPQIGDLCAFGETGRETVNLIVKYITRQGDLSATVVCVDEAPSIHTADTGPLPSFDPQTNWPGQGVIPQAPSPPVIESVQSDETVMVLTGAGYIPAVRFDFSLASATSVARTFLKVRWRRNGTGESWHYEVFPGAPDQITLTGMGDGETCDFEFQYIANQSYASEWATFGPYEVIGRTTAPDDVVGLKLIQNQLKWSYPSRPVDFAGFRVVYNFGSNSARSGAIEAHPGTLLDAAYFPVTAVPVTKVTFLVMAVDTMGNESTPVSYYTDLAAYLPGRFGDLLVSNIIETVELVPTPVAADVSTVFWGADTDAFWGADTDAFWPATVYSSLIVTRDVTPSADWVPVQMTLAWDTTIGEQIDYQTVGSAPFWGADTDAFWGADTDAFWEVDGPYSPWPGSVYVPGSNHTVSIRATLPGGALQGTVNSMVASFDVPDISEDLTNVAISAAGTRLPIIKTYRVIKAVGNVTLVQDGGTAISVRRVDLDADSGPLFYCLDASGNSTNGTIDCTVKGY